MSRVLLPVFTLVLLLVAAPASAIPICPAGTMADYLAFGTAGCQFNSLTFSDFSYSNPGGVLLGLFGPRIFPPPPPSEISVQPRSNPARLGSGGAALWFAPPPPPLPVFEGNGPYWDTVSIGFNVAGPRIVRDDLSAVLQSIANLQSAGIGETAVPGGNLGIFQGVDCQRDPFGPPPPCANPTSLSIPFTRFQEIDIAGRNVNGFEAGFATPEPATLLLVGTGAAGLGVARWVKRRRAARC
jgi:hypothetical protein